MPRVIIEQGPEKGQSAPLPTGGSVTVGREGGVQLKITDLLSSRQHFRIDNRGGEFWVVDLSSRNGTFLNGTRVLEQRLQPGDVVRVGDTHFTVHDESAPKILINIPDREPAPVVAPARARAKVAYDTSDPHAVSWFGRLFSGLITIGMIGVVGYGGWWAYNRFKPELDPVGQTPKKPARGSKAPAIARPEVKPHIQAKIDELNALVIATELARFQGKSEAEIDHEIAAAIKKAALERIAKGEFVPDHLQPGDMIASIGDKILKEMPDAEAAQFLYRTLQGLSGEGEVLHLFVHRVGEQKELHVYFSRASLTGLQPPAGAQPIVGAGGAPVQPGGEVLQPVQPAVAPPPSIGPGGRVPITQALGMEVREKIFALPRYYQNTFMTPEERGRLENILRQPDASHEEYVFVTRRILREILADVRMEQEWLKSQIRDLEKQVSANPPSDVVVTRDGKRVGGTITNNKDGTLTVRTEFGLVPVYADDVQETRTTKELQAEFTNQRQTAAQRYEAWPLLLAWTKDHGLPLHRTLTAYLILQKFPEDEAARKAAGYHMLANGRWEQDSRSVSVTATSPRKAWTRPELQQRLEDLGFFRQGERWHQRAAWSYGTDNLWTAPKVIWSASGVSLMEYWDHATRLGIEGDAQGKHEYDLGAKNLRFLGGNGTVSITVAAPAEFVECKVRALSDIRERDKSGSIRVSLHAGTKQVVLYSISDAMNEDYHDVTEHVKGKKQFVIAAELQDRRKQFPHTRFLPSIKDRLTKDGKPVIGSATRNVFHVRGFIIQPAPDVDRIWAAAN